MSALVTNEYTGGRCGKFFLMSSTVAKKNYTKQIQFSKFSNDYSLEQLEKNYKMNVEK